MKKKILSMLCLGLLLPVAMKAQYPTLTPEEEAKGDAIVAAANAHSDSAWQVALPAIEKDAAQGKPYVPWAKRPTDLLQASIPSFPGAEGGGMFTFGGRGGQVITVTNLNDDGAGSFRWACEQGGARIIVFNVAGIIKLKTPLIIRAPYITIAGQTAPGDGVCIAGESVWINTHDVIVRHMRFRKGETFVGRRDDSLGGNPVGNVMIDHVSATWGSDENMSIYRHMYLTDPRKPEEKMGTVNITIQNSIFAEGLDTWNHAFGSTIGGENCSFIRNMWANNTGRNPSIGWNGVFNFVNNVMFNWVHRSIDGGDQTSRYNIINNYFKPGPLTQVNEPVGHRILKPETRFTMNGRKVYGLVYVNGNVVEGNEDVTRDNWNGGVQIEEMKDAGEYTKYIKFTKPFPMPYMTIMSAQDAFNFVVNNAGATFPTCDPVDQRIRRTVKTGKPEYAKNVDLTDVPKFKYRRLPADSYKDGIITDIREVGGYPEYKGKPYKDSDNDGMPDAWEKANGLNPNDPSDANKDCTGDGYTNIEKYINGISTKEKTDWTNVKNNYDTLAKKGKLM